jgi:hypothetical protein
LPSGSIHTWNILIKYVQVTYPIHIQQCWTFKSLLRVNAGVLHLSSLFSTSTWTMQLLYKGKCIMMLMICFIWASITLKLKVCLFSIHIQRTMWSMPIKHAKKKLISVYLSYIQVINVSAWYQKLRPKYNTSNKMNQIIYIFYHYHS